MSTKKATSEIPAAASLVGDELVEISKLSTTVVYTATTLSAAAADNSYNDSGSQFVAEGFAVNDRVHVAGFTGNVANNIFTGRITALTTAKMTIGGTDGDVIVDDAAGESVTITKWETKRATLTDLAALVSTVAGRKYVVMLVTDPNAVSGITIGDGKAYFPCPAELNGMDLVAVSMFLTTTSSSGIPTFQIHNLTQAADMLSTKLTVDAGELTSATAAAAAVIDTANDDVATNDILRFDCDVAGTGAKGVMVIMEFELP